MNALPPGRPQESNGIALPVTFFSNFAASRKREEPCTLQTLKTQILSTTATEKSRLPWLKLARFGGTKTEKGSLRHDGNMLAVTGIEADYDGGQMGFDEAVAVLAGAGLSAIVYTSPSHTEDAPRWRVLCACSTEQQPERREHLLGRLNGLFGGVFAGESWARSQSYYYGSVRRNPSHRAEIIDGITIDRCDHLDETWIGKPGPDRSAIIPRSVSETREPVSSKRVDKLITIALNKVQAAAEGQKHATLRSQAIVLGGLQHMGRFTDCSATIWHCHPATIKVESLRT